jgi:excisionase family DNA binding protein
MNRSAHIINASPPLSAVGTPGSLALLYLRAEQVLQLLPISRRCLSNWQRERRIKFYRCGRTILFKRSDIETCLEKYAINPIGEAKPRMVIDKTTITSAPTMPCKRRAGRIAAPTGGLGSQP